MTVEEEMKEDMVKRARESRDKHLASMMDPGSSVALSKDTILSPFDHKIPQMLKEEEPPPADEDFKEHKDKDGKSIWQDKPSFEDQYRRYPESCRLIGPQIKVYNLTNSDELGKLNLMFLKQQPEDAPAIMVKSQKDNFHDGKWLMLLEYYTVEYKQLIAKK